jgi:hypothetical protein
MSDMGHQGQHGGHLHAGHGGDGQGLSHSLGLNHGHHNHSFLSHLLGLDHEHHGEHGHQAHHQSSPGPGNWAGSLQAIKLTDIFQGINVTPNTMFLLLFAGFTAWLGVIYWVRHHEPYANQVLGNKGGYSSTAHADRQLVAGIRHAMPIRTGSTMGMVYVPKSGDEATASPAGSGASVAAVVNRGPSERPVQPQPGYHPLFGSAANLRTMPDHTSVGPSFHPVATSGSGAYMVPIHNGDGVRVKTITSR